MTAAVLASTTGASRDGGSMLDKIKGLTDVGAMTRLLHETIALERGIDQELEHLLAQRQELETKLAGLGKSAEVLELVRSDSDQMQVSVRSTCDLAEHVSGKVRELDIAQSKVQETIHRIEAIVDRTNCIDGVKTALDGEDYEQAAKYVETFLELDREYSESAAAGVEGSAETVQEQRKQLLDSKQRLEELIRRRFAMGAEARDHAAVVRFAKLYSPLGLNEEGLKAYVGYMRRVIAGRGKEEYDALVQASSDMGGGRGLSKADFVGAITSLFREIAVAVEENEELLRSIAGDDAIVSAIRDLQEECNSRGTQILKRYIEQRRLSRMTKDITQRGAAAGGGEPPDTREVENYLEEMLVLSQRSEEYAHFMLGKLREAETSGAQLSPRAVSSFKTGSYNRALQELMGFYISLEEYFMVENVRKAIRLDETVSDALTTSMVDDVFYILQNCARRAIATGNIQSVLATLNSINNLLNNEFKEALQKKLREPNLASRIFGAAVASAASAAAAAAVVGGPGASKVGTDFATALNNVDVSSEYALKLKHEIEELCAEAFGTPSEREKLKACIADLGETSAAMRVLGTAGLEQLSGAITPRLRAALDAAATVSYELTEAQYAENEMNDPWVQKLLISVEEHVAWLQPILTTNNYDTLVHVIIDYIVKRLEVTFTAKRFNQLGGLQLDRDARALVGHFSGMTARTVRDKFARLTQMATVLNLEKVSEILDFWGENAGPMTWRLSPAEVRRFLALRVEFKPEAIAALRL